MAIKKNSKNGENKFAAAAAQLDEQQELEQQKAQKVVKRLSGKSREERKAMPTYIPKSLYEEFDAVCKAYGVSHNAVVCQLVRDYVSEKSAILK